MSPEQVVVDVGCGPGLYRDATPGRYVGVDSSPSSYGAQPDVVATAEDLPFADASVDVLFTLSAFYQFADPARALVEFRRVLEPGGRLLLFDYNRRAQRRLERVEGSPRPKWTAVGLRRLVAHAGFRQARLLLPQTGQPTGVRRLAALISEELRGQWAIVTAIR